jgi:hypothetical protein
MQDRDSVDRLRIDFLSYDATLTVTKRAPIRCSGPAGPASRSVLDGESLQHTGTARGL